MIRNALVVILSSSLRRYFNKSLRNTSSFINDGVPISLMILLQSSLTIFTLGVREALSVFVVGVITIFCSKASDTSLSSNIAADISSIFVLVLLKTNSAIFLIISS